MFRAVNYLARETRAGKLVYSSSVQGDKSKQRAADEQGDAVEVGGRTISGEGGNK